MPDRDRMEALREAQDKRRAALVERMSTLADLLCSDPLPGERGDVAYDLLREGAAQIASDRNLLSGTWPDQEAVERAFRKALEKEAGPLPYENDVVTVAQAVRAAIAALGLTVLERG